MTVKSIKDKNYTLDPFIPDKLATNPQCYLMAILNGEIKYIPMLHTALTRILDNPNKRDGYT